MSLTMQIDERRVAKDVWGQAAVKVSCKPLSPAQAERVKLVAEECLDRLEEAVTGQKPLPFENNGKKAADVPVRGQKTLPLGPPPAGRPVVRPGVIKGGKK